MLTAAGVKCVLPDGQADPLWPDDCWQVEKVNDIYGKPTPSLTVRCAEAGEDRDFYVVINNRKMPTAERDTSEAGYKTIRNMISHLGIFTNK